MGDDGLEPDTVEEVLPPGQRAAALVFALGVTAGLPLLLYLGRRQWFFFDEWAIFLRRLDFNTDALLLPHNDHLIAFPVLVYQALWAVFGLRTYVPYQLVVIVLHLVSLTLLRVIARRAGASPWIATTTALAFVAFGAGRQDILWAFQMTLTGSLAFGLAHLLCADHDGPIDRRDVAGICFGLLAITSSGLGVLLAALVAGVVLIRRGWKVALFHAAPLGLTYGAWLLTYGQRIERQPASLGQTVHFAARGLTNAINQIGQIRFVGVALAVVLVGGLLMASLTAHRDDGLYRLLAPVGLVGVVVIFAVSTGYSRAYQESPYWSRYVYLMAVPLIPALAVAIDALVRRWRIVGLLALAAILVGIPGNVRALQPNSREYLTVGQPGTVVVGAHLPVLRQLPRSHQPFDRLNPLTVGWVLDALDGGKIGDPPPSSPQERARLTLLAVLDASSGEAGTECAAITFMGEERVLRKGERLSFSGVALGVTLAGPPPSGGQMIYELERPRLTALIGPLHLRLASTSFDHPVMVCD